MGVSIWSRCETFVDLTSEPIEDSANEASRQLLFHDDDSDEDIHAIRANQRHDIESAPTPQKGHECAANGNESKSILKSSTSNVVDAMSIQYHLYPPAWLSSMSQGLKVAYQAAPGLVRSSGRVQASQPDAL